MKKRKQLSPKVKKRAAIEPTALEIDRAASKLRHECSSSTTGTCGDISLDSVEQCYYQQLKVSRNRITLL